MKNQAGHITGDMILFMVAAMVIFGTIVYGCML